MSVSGVEDDSEAEALHRRCSTEKPQSARKRRLATVAIEVDDDDDEPGAGGDVLLGEKAVKPLYLLSQWVEPGTMTKRLSVAIVLPSDIGQGHFSVRVVDGGEYLELTVIWPTSLIDISVMHRKWLAPGASGGFAVYHPKFLGFEVAPKELRERSSDSIEPVARVPLPFLVQSHIPGKYNLAWRDSAVKMLYIDLTAHVE